MLKTFLTSPKRRAFSTTNFNVDCSTTQAFPLKNRCVFSKKFTFFNSLFCVILQIIIHVLCYNLPMSLTELHAHVFMDGIDYKSCVNRHKMGVDKEWVKTVLTTYKNAGIDMIRDGGDPYGVSLYAKSIAKDFGITYLTPAFAIYKQGNYGKILGRAYSDLNEYRQLISDARALGADYIKLILSGILDFNQVGVVSETDYPLELVKELVHIAHEEGFAVMAHVSGSSSILNACIAGVDSLEHGYYVTQEAMDIMAEKNILWVPTCVTSENLLSTDRYDNTAVSAIFEGHVSAMLQAFSSDVLLGCGSDAGAFPVLHAKGALQEKALFESLFKDKTNELLERSAQLVLEKFQYSK